MLKLESTTNKLLNKSEEALSIFKRTVDKLKKVNAEIIAENKIIDKKVSDL